MFPRTLCLVGCKPLKQPVLGVGKQGNVMLDTFDLLGLDAGQGNNFDRSVLWLSSFCSIFFSRSSIWRSFVFCFLRTVRVGSSYIFHPLYRVLTITIGDITENLGRNVVLLGFAAETAIYSHACRACCFATSDSADSISSIRS